MPVSQIIIQILDSRDCRAADIERTAMSSDRVIWFKRVLWRYYPVHVFGWISLVFAISLSGVFYLSLSWVNKKLNVVDDVFVVFVSIAAGLAILACVARKHV